MLGIFKSRLFLGYWLPVLIYCLAIFLQSAFPSPEGLPVFPFSDKVEHFLAYALMGVLFFRALKGTWPHWRISRVIILSVLLTTLYGMGDEFHQSFVASRTADIMDVLADFTGGMFGALFLGILSAWRTGAGLSD